jgi:hypothetical protein
MDAMNNRKLAGYTLGAISLFAVAVAIFAVIALIANPGQALPIALTLLIAIPVAYITRKIGVNLRQ